ncbi:MAG: type I-B CRISPR-associated endonuclease Cas1b [Caldisphaera sp.]
MAKSIYLNKNCIMKVKHSTLLIVYKNDEGKTEKRVIPINDIYDIYAHGMTSITSGAILLLAKFGLPVHFFNYYGYFRSSLLPKKKLISGSLLIRQAEHYLDKNKRAEIAREILRAATYNILRNLYYYNKSSDKIAEIESLMQGLNKYNDISELMGIEGNIRDIYYSALDEILPEEFKIVIRTRRPPTNYANALISFGNSLLYASTITEIYNTHLDQTISFLHEPSERRFSLSLDLSEIFKPIIVDRIILGLVNRKMLDSSFFDQRVNGVILNEKGRKLFIEQYESKMSSTAFYKKLKRKVSIRHLIRLECYKLEKHLLGIEKFSGLRAWW